MGAGNHPPDLSASRRTIEDKLDNEELQRGKKFPNYQTNAYHVQQAEKKESWTHLGPDLNQEHPVVSTPPHPILRYPTLSYPILLIYSVHFILLYLSLIISKPCYHILPYPIIPRYFSTLTHPNLTYPIPFSTNLLFYYTTSFITPRDYTLLHPTICHLMRTCSSLLYATLSTLTHPNLTYSIPFSTNLLFYYTTSLITPRDYTLLHPTICHLMLTCSSILYAILSRSPIRGCLECRLAEGKLLYGKWGTNIIPNDVLLQEVAMIKALSDLGSGRSIKLWEGMGPTFIAQYKVYRNILLRTAAAPCNVVDTAFLAQGHSMLGLDQGGGVEMGTNTKPLAAGQSKGACGQDVSIKTGH